jgi:polysaccharide pyruvyl transferase WcaK-like protein
LDIEVVPSFWSLAGVNRDKNIIKQLFRLIWYFIRIAFSTKTKIINKKEEEKEKLVKPWKQLSTAYQRADMIVGVSGNQFYSTGRFGWPFPASICSPAMAHIFKKPLYILPQSIGPLKRWWERSLLSIVYSKARKIYLRDTNSISLANEIGLPNEKVEYSPDPAFQLTPAPKTEALKILGKYGYSKTIPTLGLTVIAPMGHSLITSQVENYYSVVKNCIERFLKTHQAKVMIFNQVSGPTKSENDGYYSELIFKELQSKSLDVVHVNEQLDPRLLKACYGQMTGFIASRLHSGIFSLSMEVPTLFIGYLSKTKGLLDACGLNETIIELGNLTEEIFWTKLNNIWCNREGEKEKIKEVLPRILAETSKPQEFIRKDYLNA